VTAEAVQLFDTCGHDGEGFDSTLGAWWKKTVPKSRSMPIHPRISSPLTFGIGVIEHDRIIEDLSHQQ